MQPMHAWSICSVSRYGPCGASCAHLSVELSPGPVAGAMPQSSLLESALMDVKYLPGGVVSSLVGALHPWDASLWSSVCLVPLDKGGGKIRPIALGEALPKLAQAALLDTLEAQLRQAFEPQQLSVRSPGGAEVLARTLRAWTAQPEGRLLLQLDLKNAYGRMMRSHTLRAVVRRCPAFAPQLAQQWAPGVTWVWARTDGIFGRNY